MSLAEKSKKFLEHYDALSDAIFRHCYFRLSDRGRAQEITQETFLRAWNKVVSNLEPDNMKAFLYKIANNLIIDEYRKKKTSSLDELQEAGVEFASIAHIHLKKIIEGKDVINFLSKLDEKYKNIIIMRYIDDLNPKEIAEIMGISENMVSVRLHRGLKQIRRILDN